MVGRSAARLDEHHVAVRFGDLNREGRWRVELDGIAVENDVDEAYAGRDGWVYFCPRTQPLVPLVVFGEVRIKWTPEEPGGEVAGAIGMTKGSR